MPGILEKLAIDRPAPRAWALYDWANSAMVTTIITAIFPIYFLNVAAEGLDKTVATQRYSLATTISLAAVAVLAPLLGALADYSGIKKRLLFTFAGLGMAATSALFFVQQGDWLLGLVLFGLANLGASGSFVFYDALLPHVAREGEMDRLSTTAYALGYVGGGLLLALNLAWIQFPAAFGLPAGEGETLPARLAFVSVAVWWGVFSIPLWRRVSEPPRLLESDERVGLNPVRVALTRLSETLRELRGYRQAFLMLVAFLLYNDGIMTIIRMAAIYADGQGIPRGTVIGAILGVQFVGMPFAILAGRLAGRIGARGTVFLGLAVYGLITLIAFRMDSVTEFLILAFLVATVQGGTQALSRSLFASLIPRHKSAEFFAFFAVGEKFAGILGPALFTLMIASTGSAQNAILSVLVFFVAGGFLLTRVDVEAGREAARAADMGTRPG